MLLNLDCYKILSQYNSIYLVSFYKHLAQPDVWFEKYIQFRKIDKYTFEGKIQT